MFENVEVMNNSGHVKVSILIRELNSGVSDVTSFGVVIVPSTR